MPRKGSETGAPGDITRDLSLPRPAGESAGRRDDAATVTTN